MTHVLASANSQDSEGTGRHAWAAWSMWGIVAFACNSVFVLPWFMPADAQIVLSDSQAPGGLKGRHPDCDGCASDASLIQRDFEFHCRIGDYVLLRRVGSAR
jgi:hypothetical protein